MLFSPRIKPLKLLLRASDSVLEIPVNSVTGNRHNLK